MTNQGMWIGIAVGLFFAGIVIGYVIFVNTNHMSGFGPMMGGDPFDAMMNNPQIQQQMMNQMMQDPQFVKQMGQMMSDPEFQKQMIQQMENHDSLMHEMMQDYEMREHMMGHMMEDEELMQNMGLVRDTKFHGSNQTSMHLISSGPIVSLSDNDSFELSAGKITKIINGTPLQMFGYNQQTPGPLLLVNQGDEISVNFKNNLDFPTTVHWHGLRLNNTSDGVPGITQKPIMPGETFDYRLKFPDSGVFIYHPHVRTEMQMDLGLYGNILVEPSIQNLISIDYQVPLILDDILLTDGKIPKYDHDITTHALMGRFGNTMMINGDADYSLQVKQGDVVRFYLTNTANTRTFDFAIEQHSVKLIADDASDYEQEKIVDSVIIASSERKTVDVFFESPGQYKITHTTPEKKYVLGNISVTPSHDKRNLDFYKTSKNLEIIQEIDSFRKYFSDDPDLEIEFDIKTISMPSMNSEHDPNSMQMDGHDKEIHQIEWEDEMPKMNAMSNDENTQWILRDLKTGNEGFDIDYQANVGDIKKIRFFNNPESAHPMQHPIHLHGQRFLVISQDGILNENLAWKDTVLVPTGKTVDILVEFSNPGKWAMHCHILEHAESGMITEVIVN